MSENIVANAASESDSDEKHLNTPINIICRLEHELLVKIQKVLFARLDSWASVQKASDIYIAGPEWTMLKIQQILNEFGADQLMKVGPYCTQVSHNTQVHPAICATAAFLIRMWEPTRMPGPVFWNMVK